MLTFLVFAGMIGWLTSIAWQLRLASTKGKIWSRNGYVTRASNETTFEGCVLITWVMLAFGFAMLVFMIVATIKEVAN
ncbi:hypothetical protein [Bradyrhizobium sp. CB2312]|uniref:hypothetical protein n=1 Tax=Bradyrhizobium sp. CB2312 TaxID=3039155 RepID=UPI0024B18EB5|nr:hypothetical protein [Bradyrhizobium sp. CB2312]WFU72611.1 hypothetical protein QA642_00565 [Bradyrhizobium sp. CB2312]